MKKICKYFEICEQSEKTVRNCAKCVDCEYYDSGEIKITDKILQIGRHNFEIVTKLPYGYEIWNIGRHNFPFVGYIPLAQVDKDYAVNVNTLKTIKVKSEEFALELMKKEIEEDLGYKGLKNILEKEAANEN